MPRSRCGGDDAIEPAPIAGKAALASASLLGHAAPGALSDVRKQEGRVVLDADDGGGRVPDHHPAWTNHLHTDPGAGFSSGLAGADAFSAVRMQQGRVCLDDGEPDAHAPSHTPEWTDFNDFDPGGHAQAIAGGPHVVLFDEPAADGATACGSGKPDLF